MPTRHLLEYRGADQRKSGSGKRIYEDRGGRQQRKQWRNLQEMVTMRSGFHITVQPVESEVTFLLLVGVHTYKFVGGYLVRHMVF